MQRYSVFLTPGAEDFEYAQNLIRELSGKYDEPPFEPHVTVYTGNLEELDLLTSAVSAATAGVPPFSLRIRGIGCSEEYFRTLYLEFEESPLLRGVAEKIRSELGDEPGFRLFPHLSLLYKDMPLRDKQALADRIAPDRSEMRFNAVKIVTPANRSAGWRDTSQWKTLYSRSLEDNTGKGGKSTC